MTETRDERIARLRYQGNTRKWVFDYRFQSLRKVVRVEDYTWFDARDEAVRLANQLNETSEFNRNNVREVK